MCSSVFVFDLTWVFLVSLIRKTQSSHPQDASYEADKPVKYNNNSPQTFVSSGKPDITATVIYFARPAGMITGGPEIVMTFEDTANLFSS